MIFPFFVKEDQLMRTYSEGFRNHVCAVGLFSDPASDLGALDNPLYIYIYIYMYVFLHVCMHIYIYNVETHTPHKVAMHLTRIPEVGRVTAAVGRLLKSGGGPFGVGFRA